MLQSMPYVVELRAVSNAIEAYIIKFFIPVYFALFHDKCISVFKIVCRQFSSAFSWRFLPLVPELC